MTRQRGGSRLRRRFPADTTSNRDSFTGDEVGGQYPLLNVLSRVREGSRRRWASEPFLVPGENGQGTRHVAAVRRLWHVLHATPEVRGESWYPQPDYTDR